MAKYLDLTGLSQVWTAIKQNFVRKEEGKGLSHNDYTDEDVAKLASIEASAQTNVIEEVKVNGSALTITDKAVDIIIPSAEVTGVKEGEKILSLDGTELETTLSISIEASGESQNDHIVLRGKNDAVVAAVDASAFVVDGMLSSVTLSGDSLVFIFNTDAGEKEIDVDLHKFIDVYTAGNGIDITENEISVKLAEQQGNVVLDFDGEGGLKADVDLSDYALVDDVNHALSSLTEEVNQALDDLEGDLAAHVEDGDIHVTAEQKSDWQSATDHVEASADTWDSVSELVNASAATWSDGQANVIEKVQVNGNDLDISSKTVNVQISGTTGTSEDSNASSTGDIEVSYENGVLSISTTATEDQPLSEQEIESILTFDD